MDTGDLSNEAYRAILIEAEIFHHDLTLQFGFLSGECENEEEFIQKSLELIEEMEECDASDFDEIFYGNPPERKDFDIALKTIKRNIEEVKKIPLEKRNYSDE